MSTNNAPSRAALYARLSVSTDESTSIDRQRQQADGWSAMTGAALVAEFVDDGVSGDKAADKRPGLSAALEAAARGEFDTLVVVKLDRLARNVSEFLDISRRLDTMGVQLVSMAESLDMGTPAGRMVATVLAAFAEMERGRIAERVTESNTYLASLGAVGAGPAPYGWAKVRQADGRLRLELDAEQGPMLRAAVDHVLAGGTVAGAVALVEGLGDDGLRKVLRHPILLGRHTFRGELVTGADGLPMTPHEALVTWGEWSALQAALDAAAGPAGRPTGWHGDDALLAGSGLLSCSRCGTAMHVNRMKRADMKSGVRVTYVCDTGCTSASASGVDAAVEAEFLAAVGRLPVVERTAVASEAGEQLAQARERQANVMELVSGGLLPMDLAREQLATLAATVARLEVEAAGGADVVEHATGLTFAEHWAAADLAERRGLLLRAVGAITVGPGERGRRTFDPSRVQLQWAS